MTRLRAVIVTTAVVVATPLVFAGCTSSHPAASPSTSRTLTTPAYDASVRTARCADWLAAPAKERQRLASGMRAFFGDQVDASRRGQALTERRTYELFDTYCAHSFASSFSLYRIYGNAAGFTPPG